MLSSKIGRSHHQITTELVNILRYAREHELLTKLNEFETRESHFLTSEPEVVIKALLAYALPSEKGKKKEDVPLEVIIHQSAIFDYLLEKYGSHLDARRTSQLAQKVMYKTAEWLKYYISVFENQTSQDQGFYNLYSVICLGLNRFIRHHNLFLAQASNISDEATRHHFIETYRNILQQAFKFTEIVKLRKEAMALQAMLSDLKIDTQIVLNSDQPEAFVNLVNLFDSEWRPKKIKFSPIHMNVPIDQDLVKEFEDIKNIAELDVKMQRYFQALPKLSLENSEYNLCQAISDATSSIVTALENRIKEGQADVFTIMILEIFQSIYQNVNQDIEDCKIARAVAGVAKQFVQLTNETDILKCQILIGNLLLKYKLLIMNNQKLFHSCVSEFFIYDKSSVTDNNIASLCDVVAAQFLFNVLLGWSNNKNSPRCSNEVMIELFNQSLFNKNNHKRQLVERLRSANRNEDNLSLYLFVREHTFFVYNHKAVLFQSGFSFKQGVDLLNWLLDACVLLDDTGAMEDGVADFLTELMKKVKGQSKGQSKNTEALLEMKTVEAKYQGFINKRNSRVMSVQFDCYGLIYLYMNSWQTRHQNQLKVHKLKTIDADIASLINDGDELPKMDNVVNVLTTFCQAPSDLIPLETTTKIRELLLSLNRKFALKLNASQPLTLNELLSAGVIKKIASDFLRDYMLPPIKVIEKASEQTALTSDSVPHAVSSSDVVDELIEQIDDLIIGSPIQPTSAAVSSDVEKDNSKEQQARHHQAIKEIKNNAKQQLKTAKQQVLAEHATLVADLSGQHTQEEADLQQALFKQHEVELNKLRRHLAQQRTNIRRRQQKHAEQIALNAAKLEAQAQERDELENEQKRQATELAALENEKQTFIETATVEFNQKQSSAMAQFEARKAQLEADYERRISEQNSQHTQALELMQVDLENRIAALRTTLSNDHLKHAQVLANEKNDVAVSLAALLDQASSSISDQLLAPRTAMLVRHDLEMQRMRALATELDQRYVEARQYHIKGLRAQASQYAQEMQNSIDSFESNNNAQEFVDVILPWERTPRF